MEENKLPETPYVSIFYAKDAPYNTVCISVGNLPSVVFDQDMQKGDSIEVHPKMAEILIGTGNFELVSTEN